MRKIQILSILAISGILGAALAACAKEGPAERAGKQIDQAAQDIKEDAGRAADDVKEAAADLKDKLLRLMADMENLRRRTAREITDARTYAVTNFARDMLNVADNVRRAIESVPEEASNDIAPNRAACRAR